VPKNFAATGFNIQMGYPFSHFLAKKLSGITFGFEIQCSFPQKSLNSFVTFICFLYFKV
jgi:hypothetical protein